MIASLEPAAGKRAAPGYDLKIVLLGAEPLIWRRLRVPGSANLGWLHAVLPVAIGWTNSHLFDAERFDPAQINLWLRKLKWPRVTEAQPRKVLMGRDNYREE